MFYVTIKSTIRLLVLLALVGTAGVALQTSPVEASVDNNNGPELPVECGSIAIDEGHKLAFHVYAKGVQIYKWNGTSWDFVAPEATLVRRGEFFRRSRQSRHGSALDQQERQQSESFACSEYRLPS